MIKINNLSISYNAANKQDELAIEDIKLEIKKNSTCAIIGPSGCGKTTLIYALAGLLKADKGSINIFGERQDGIRQETGLILQNYGLLPWKTTKQNVALGLKVRGQSPELTNHIVDDILLKLGVLEYQDKYPTQLSGGQRQRVAIGRALAIAPDLLLMDEPSSALDAITKEQLQNLVLKIYKDSPMTVVLVTHNIAEAVFLGQKIVVMKKAGIKQILENPYFGDELLREKMDFYRVCLEVRKCLEKE